RSVIATPMRVATSAVPPATVATPPLTSPSSTDGKGWVRRTQPRARDPTVGAESDVDELAEVRDEVLDEPIAAVGDLRADAGNERVEGDRRHHQPALAIAAHDRRRSPAGSEHPFETVLVQAGRPPEIGHDLDDPAANRDVAHQLRGPRVDLVVALLGEAL